MSSCNGHPDLCARPYNEVVYATTHNSYSHAEGGWIAPSQQYSIPRQLVDGVRALMIDVHLYNGLLHYLEGETYVCHEYCVLGAEPLVRTLGYVKTFLDSHPREVVTIFFESYVSREAAEEAFVESGLISYAHTQNKQDPWPTLGNMIEEGKRLVVFSDRGSGSTGWYHDVWDFAWDTDWSVNRPKEFTCHVKRGDMANDLFILNHFLTNPIGAAFLAERVNYNPFLLDRAIECEEVSAKLPNFITVDFYAVGDLFEAVDMLNGLGWESEPF